jgi:hypothetical protein
MKKLRAPRVIHVGHVPIRIEYKLQLPGDEMGLFSSGTNYLVQVAAIGCVAQQASTEYHELLHAASELFGLELSEGQVRALEWFFAYLATHEPELIDDIIARLRS